MASRRLSSRPFQGPAPLRPSTSSTSHCRQDDKPIITTIPALSTPPGNPQDAGGFVIAIDGPAGAGKGTVARTLARQLGFAYIDTGAMYRCVALQSQRLGTLADDEEGLTRLARALRLEFAWIGPVQQVLMNGEDVSQSIRANEISRLASRVSTVQGVREAMVHLQRKMGNGVRVIMEGRDIGTVVFPDAQLKIYLTASLDERARRRAIELERAGEAQTDMTQVRDELAERDERDQKRDLAPLAVAPDAIVVSTDGLSIDAVVEQIAALLPATSHESGGTNG